MFSNILGTHPGHLVSVQSSLKSPPALRKGFFSCEWHHKGALGFIWMNVLCTSSWEQHLPQLPSQFRACLWGSTLPHKPHPPASGTGAQPALQNSFCYVLALNPFPPNLLVSDLNLGKVLVLSEMCVPEWMSQRSWSCLSLADFRKVGLLLFCLVFILSLFSIHSNINWALWYARLCASCWGSMAEKPFSSCSLGSVDN